MTDLRCNVDDIPRIARLGLTVGMSPAIWQHPIVQKAPLPLKWLFNDILKPVRI
jgi:hypothetical protein